MSTDFGIKIAVDPGNSKSGIDGLTDALTKLETQGAKVNERMRDSKGRLSDTAAGAKQAGEALSGLTEEEKEFERMVLLGNAAKAAEEQMLKKLIGPMQQLEREIELINTLHEKGAIDANTFTDAITKRNQALARMQPRSGAGFDSTAGQQYGPTFDSAKAGGGEADAAGGGGGIGGLAGMLGVGLGVGTITGLMKALSGAADEYTEIENRVRKFADASGGLNETMAQQRDLSVSIHASLGDSIGLYDRVTSSTRNLYLSQQQQMDITKALGLAAKENNVSLESAEGVMKRFTAAADTGTFSMRFFRQIDQEMPQLLDAMAKSMGLTIKQFEDMAIAGKIAPREIALAISGTLPGAEARIESYGRTSKERMQETAVAFANAGTNANKAFDIIAHGGPEAAAAAEQLRAKLDEINNKTRMAVDAQTALAESFAITKRVLQELTDPTYQLKLRMDDYTNSIGAADIKLKMLQEQKQKFIESPSLGAADPGFSRQLDLDIAKQKLLVDALHNSVPEAAVKVGQTDLQRKADIEGLTIASHNLALTDAERADAAKALAEIYKKEAREAAGLRSEIEKMEDKLLRPFQQYKLELAAIQDLQQRMPQYADVWAEELEKINAKNPGMLLLEATIKRHVAAYDAAAKSAREWREAAGFDPGLNAPGLLDASGNGTDDPLAHAGGGVRFGADQLRDASAARAGLAVGQPALDKLEELNEKLRASYAELTEGSAQKFTDQMVKYGQDLENGVIPSQDEYNKLVLKLHQQYDDMKTPQEVFAQGAKEIKDKVDAQVYSLEAADRAMRKLREATGQGTFGDGFNSFIENLKKQSEDSKVALDLLNAGFSGLNTGIMDLIESKGSLAEWGASFISTLAKVAEQALAAKAVLALIGLATPAAPVDGIADYFAHRPGHASGAYYPPGGSGGTDSQFIAFRKSPDEDVLVRTPEQRAAMAQGSAAPAIHIHTGGRDRRDLPPPGPSRGEIHVMIQQEVARATRRR